MEFVDYQCVDYKHRHLTGYFRDGERRIDLVLVGRDSKREQLEVLKLNFFMNLINAGLELEIENGIMKRHKHLYFVKIHAPAHILKHFGSYYSITKFFKKNHLDMSEQNIREEREIIKLIRESYPEPVLFSTHERSVIVYKMLEVINFGEYKNYVGIHKLLERKIILDAYALHDGPFFLVRRQKPTHVNGRQALMLNWVGYRNLYRCQPIHLIREYLGERLAFLFKFHERIVLIMFLAGLAGPLFFYLNMNLKSRYGIINSAFSDNEAFEDPSASLTKLRADDEAPVTIYLFMALCPKCADFVACPLRLLKDYRLEVGIKERLDNPFNIYFSLYVVILEDMVMFHIPNTLFSKGVLNHLLWRRTESYLHWIWEVHPEDSKVMRRPEYRHIPHVSPGLRGRLKYFKAVNRFLHRIHFNQLWRGSVRFLFLVFFLSFYMLLVLPAMIQFNLKVMNRLRYVEETLPAMTERAFKMNYLALLCVSITNALFIFCMEYVWPKLTRIITLFENNRTEREFEESYVNTLFIYSFMFNFGLIYFFSFIKELLYTFPFDVRTYDLPLQLGAMNCGMLACLEEIFIVFVATFRFKLCFQEFFSILHGFYNRNDVPIPNPASEYGMIPCWEREYTLRPLSEDFVMERFNQIMIEFAASLLFITVFPFAPLIFFLINIFRIRHLAKVVLVHSRRPVLSQNWGLGPWRKVLFILPFIIAFTHGVHMARNSHLLDINFNQRHNSHRGNRFFLDHYLSIFNMSDLSLIHDQVYYKKYLRYITYFLNIENRDGFKMKRYVNDTDSGLKADIMKYLNGPSKENPETVAPGRDETETSDNATSKGFSTDTYYTYPHDISHCMFPNHFKNFIWPQGDHHIVSKDSYTAEPVQFYMLWYRALFFLFYELLVILISVLFHYWIRPKCPQAKKMLYVEGCVMEYHGRRKEKTA